MGHLACLHCTQVRTGAKKQRFFRGHYGSHFSLCVFYPFLGKWDILLVFTVPKFVQELRSSVFSGDTMGPILASAYYIQDRGSISREKGHLACLLLYLSSQGS